MVGVDKYRYYFSFVSFPIPVRQDMERFFFLVPMTAIEIITVFRQSGKVDDAEKGRMAWPVRILSLIHI